MWVFHFSDKTQRSILIVHLTWQKKIKGLGQTNSEYTSISTILFPLSFFYYLFYFWNQNYEENKVHDKMAFSQGLKLSDLNDFISPSQACIKPVEVKKTNSSTSVSKY